MYIVYLRRNCKRQNSIVEHGVVSGVSRNVANPPKQKQCKCRQKLIHIFFTGIFLFFETKNNRHCKLHKPSLMRGALWHLLKHFLFADIVLFTLSMFEEVGDKILICVTFMSFLYIVMKGK